MCFYISFVYFFWLFVDVKEEMFFLWGYLSRTQWDARPHRAPAPRTLKAGCLQVVQVSVPLPWPVPSASHPCLEEPTLPHGGQVPVAETQWCDGGWSCTSSATIRPTTAANAPVSAVPGSTPIQSASAPAKASPTNPHSHSQRTLATYSPS